MALRDVIGQESAVSILLRTIHRERIPSAYLFAGESGIGKKFTALNLAKALNCQSSEPRAKMDACDRCPSCKKIDAVSHPDVLLISPRGGQIRIEEIRAIDEMLSFKPFEGRKKIVVVDEADAMNPYAANAFLKTLEEPPEGSLIILVSSKPDRLPDTIRSRCSRVNFTPLSYEACKRVIEGVIGHQSLKKKLVKSHKSLVQVTNLQYTNGQKSAKCPMTSDPIDLLVRLSMGRPGLAISSDLIEERTWFLKLLRGMLKVEKDGWTSGEEMERWLDFIVILLRDVAILKITQEEENLINLDIKDYIKKISSSMDIKVIIKYYQELNALKGYLKFNLNKSLTWNYVSALLRGSMDSTYV